MRRHATPGMPLFDAIEAPTPDVPIRDPTFPAAEHPRAKRLHKLLAARHREGPATTHELAAVCLRFGARLHEMKRAGFLWTCEQVGPGTFRYRMLRDYLPDGPAAGRRGETPERGAS